MLGRYMVLADGMGGWQWPNLKFDNSQHMHVAAHHALTESLKDNGFIWDRIGSVPMHHYFSEDKSEVHFFFRAQYYSGNLVPQQSGQLAWLKYEELSSKLTPHLVSSACKMLEVYGDLGWQPYLTLEERLARKQAGYRRKRRADRN